MATMAGDAVPRGARSSSARRPDSCRAGRARRVHLRGVLDQPDHARPVHLLLRAVHPEGSLLLGGDLSGAYLVFQTITYASLIAAMPRAGGDYVWISRVLGGGIGFVLAVCGWWFILWHWVPIYANILNVEVLRAAGGDRRLERRRQFWASRRACSPRPSIAALLASIFVAIGMRATQAPEALLLRRLVGLLIISGS